MKTKLKSNLFLFPLLLILLTAGNRSIAQDWDAAYQSMIIVKVQEMSTEQYSDIISGISEDSKMTFEYACRETGVVVLKLHHNYESKADAKNFILPQLKKFISSEKIELIYIDLKQGVSDKC